MYTCKDVEKHACDESEKYPVTLGGEEWNERKRSSVTKALSTEKVLQIRDISINTII